MSSLRKRLRSDGSTNYEVRSMDPKTRSQVSVPFDSETGSPILPQLVLAHLLASGAYDRHLRLIRTRQRRRRDAIITALHQHLPDARVEGVAAGLHLLITLPDLPDDTDDTALAAAVRRAGVHVHPLSWHRHHPGPPGLILGYAAHPPDRLHNAVHRLAAALPRHPPELDPASR